MSNYNEGRRSPLSLNNAINQKMLEVNRAYLAQHGLEGVDMASDLAEDLYERQIASNFINFDRTVQHVGKLLGGHAFTIEYAFPQFAAEPDTAYDKQLESRSREQAILLNPKVIKLDILNPKKSKSEEWCVWLTPDSPPYAINEADARQVKTAAIDFDAARLVRQGFGQDAIPMLTREEASLLAHAVTITPAVVDDKDSIY